MASYFDINEGFRKYVERMKEAQKTVATISTNLINDTTLLRIGIEHMRNCGLFDKALNEWEEIFSINQTWEDIITYFQNAEGKFNLKKSIHGKRVTLEELTQ